MPNLSFLDLIQKDAQPRFPLGLEVNGQGDNEGNAYTYVQVGSLVPGTALSIQGAPFFSVGATTTTIISVFGISIAPQLGLGAFGFIQTRGLAKAIVSYTTPLAGEFLEGANGGVLAKVSNPLVTPGRVIKLMEDGTGLRYVYIY